MMDGRMLQVVGRMMHVMLHIERRGTFSADTQTDDC